ncbi:MAG: dipeptide epimerase [Candidatus Sumerlaeia bacterium]|nr:dipeptide epimerase [Candidatus Sumerlaeia bacterium]
MSRTDTGRLRIIEFKKILEHPFGVGQSTTAVSRSVLIECEGSWGEAAPSQMYGETIESVMAVLSKPLPGFPDGDEDPGAYLDEAAAGELGRNRSALAALDMLLYDRWARAKGQPLWRLLGVERENLPVSSFTIGIDDIETMLGRIQTAGTRSPVLKIKLGRHPDQDAETMRAIRSAAPDKVLRVDANQGWSLAQAERLIPAMAELGVEFVEQPLPRGAVDEMRRLKDISPLPLYLDEDCHTAGQIPSLASMAHGVNVKLVKSGGIREAVRIVEAARSHGLGLMIGCMVETSAGITAAAHIGPLFDHIDLDGHVLIANDPFEGCGWEGGKLMLGDSPGLGVTLRPGVSL